MAKKWRVGVIYELVDKTGFLEYAVENAKILPYISDKFTVLELTPCRNVVSVESVDLNIISRRRAGDRMLLMLTSGERKFFKRVEDN